MVASAVVKTFGGLVRSPRIVISTGATARMPTASDANHASHKSSSGASDKPSSFSAATAGIATVPDYAWSVAGGVSGGLGVALLFHVLARGPVATAAPVVAVCGVAMPAIAGLAFGERPGALAIGGIVLAALAVGLVSAASGVG